MADLQPDDAATAGLSDNVRASGPIRIGDGSAAEKSISCVSCRKRKLKCDRAKPACSTCSRLRHECEYPERRRNLGTKRRNMKELEARLAQVETQLVEETNAKKSRNPSMTEASVDMSGMGWDGLGMDMNIDFDDVGLADQMFDISQYQMPADNILFQPEPIFSQELIGLGIQEPLPPQDMMDELFALYFERFHPTMPIMHKSRFYASLDRPPNARPPICLRYAMWTMAASLDEKYLDIEPLLYERSRKYIQDEEMKGYGEAFISVHHAQTWGLIASYEAKKTLFSRSWMSAGRMVRLIHMLGLDRLDTPTAGIKTILPPAKDVIELEERRRTFWGAFYADRWSSSGTGWPMIINEDEIRTNLPCSEYCFEQGIEEPTNALADALNQSATGRISPFSGVIMAATLFGHNFQHLHKAGVNENPDDLQNGEFWKRHRRMDNVLSNTFMFLPDHLRLPAGVNDMNVVFLNLNIHTSAICLHQAAAATATKHKLDPSFAKQAQSRCLTAADEITNILRSVSHVDPAKMHSWVGFCLYIAAGIYVKNQATDQFLAQALPNLDFLLAAMRAIGRKHSITKHFIAQLELDIDAAGLTKKGPTADSQNTKIPNLPINGLLVDRQGMPMTFEDISGYHTHGSSSSSERVTAVTPDSNTSDVANKVTSACASPDDDPDRTLNPARIPANYFPGAKTPTQWSSHDSLDFSSTISNYQTNNNPADIQPFIQGMNTMRITRENQAQDGISVDPVFSVLRDAHTARFGQGVNLPQQHKENQQNQQAKEDVGMEPIFSMLRDGHTARFRQGDSQQQQQQQQQQQPPEMGQGLCPWADADPAVRNEWEQRSGFTDSNSQNLNPGVRADVSTYYHTDTDWV